MLEPKEMEKYFEKEENKSLGFRIGTISLSHKLLCRIFILCLCGLFSFVLVSVFVSIRGEVGCRNRVTLSMDFLIDGQISSFCPDQSEAEGLKAY